MALRANQADQGLIQYEAGQELVAMEMLTTTDGTTYATSDAPWSGAAGKEPVIYPNGLATGGAVTPTASANDSIDVADSTAYLAGVLTTITADTLTHAADALTRPGADEFVTHSIIITAAGAYDVQPGTPTADQSGYSTTRGATGGPPVIGVGDIEIAQVKMTGTAAQVTTSDISQIPGATQERYDYPLFTEDYGTGEVTFISANPGIHTGGAHKRVYAEYYTPTFAPLEPASDFVPPETTHSQSSTAVYGGAIGSSSSSLGQGSFSAYLRDGVTDALLALKNQKLWFKFFPHRLRAPHILAQGILGISRQFPADNSIVAECTITADGAAIEVAE